MLPLLLLLTQMHVDGIIMNMDISRELHVQSPENWLKDQDGFTYLHDPVEGTPLRGYNLDQDPNKVPYVFSDDMDTKDGLTAWRMAADNAENVFDVGVLLTDPSRSDGLGDPEQLKELVGAYDMVGYATTRGVLHAIWQHGTFGAGETIPSQWLGQDTPHPAFSAQLDEAFRATGTPNFRIDPSIKSGFAVPTTRLVQRIRDEVFNLADTQTDIREPEDLVVLTDMVHVNSLGHLMVAKAGLQMDVTAGENPDGIYPNSTLLIVPAELSDIIDKQKVARGFTDTNAEHKETQVYLAHDSFVEDEYFSLYAMALREGRVPIPA